jgi:hypothetical protein
MLPDFTGQLLSHDRPLHIASMKNFVEVIANELRDPEGRDLQERCLESMVLMERYRKMSTVTEIVPNTIDADISFESISSLADGCGSALHWAIRPL